MYQLYDRLHVFLFRYSSELRLVSCELFSPRSMKNSSAGRVAQFASDARSIRSREIISQRGQLRSNLIGSIAILLFIYRPRYSRARVRNYTRISWCLGDGTRVVSFTRDNRTGSTRGGSMKISCLPRHRDRVYQYLSDRTRFKKAVDLQVRATGTRVQRRDRFANVNRTRIPGSAFKKHKYHARFQMFISSARLRRISSSFSINKLVL